MASLLGFSSLLGFLLCMQSTSSPFSEARDQGWNMKEDDFSILTADIEVLAPVPKEVAASALGFGGRKTIDIVQAVVHPPTTQVSSATSNDGEGEDQEEKMITETTTMTMEKKKKKKKKLLEASFEVEIVKLMHKDYVSKGPPRAKRRPPINNHEPIH